MPRDVQQIEEGLRDIRPIYEASGDLTWLWLSCVFLCVFIVIILYFKKINDKNNNNHKISNLKSDITAKISKIKTLKEVREVYKELSYILRYFMEHRFGINALEMTVNEFSKAIKDINAIKGDHKSKLIELCCRIEKIVYAPYYSEKIIMEDDINFVESFLNEHQVSEKVVDL